MKLSLRARVLVAMFGAILAANGVFFLTVRAAADAGAVMSWTVPAADLARCEAQPEAWSQAVADLAQAWAYDETGRSRNPAAPVLEPDLVAEMTREDWVASFTSTGRVEVRRMAPTGPCSFVLVRFSPPEVLRTRVGIGIVAGGAFAVVAVLALAIGLVLQPLLGRITRIRAAAAAVGSAHFEPGADPHPDDLGRISGVLDTSHARIRDNEAELVARQRALERHLAEIAHDLRTPLASLLLAVQDLATTTSPEGRGAISRALDDAEYVNALLDNLHQGTRLREGLETGAGQVDLVEVVERLTIRFRALGALREVEVAAAVPDGPLVVAGNPALAERAIANLVHNAVRHGRAGGHVALLLDRASDGFELVVVDDGPGLRPDDLATLQATTFLTETARRRGGGLGVAITNGVCARFGWSIRYETGDEGGLRVTIRSGR